MMPNTDSKYDVLQGIAAAFPNTVIESIPVENGCTVVLVHRETGRTQMYYVAPDAEPEGEFTETDNGPLTSEELAAYQDWVHAVERRLASKRIPSREEWAAYRIAKADSVTLWQPPADDETDAEPDGVLFVTLR